MIDETLLSAVQHYHREPDDTNLDRAVQALGAFLYRGLGRFRIDCRNEDARSDFIAWLYPRLPSIVRHWDERRSSFGTYITWVIRLSWRTFWRDRYGREARQRILEADAFTTLVSEETDRSNSSDWNVCADGQEDYFPDARKRRRESGAPKSAKRKELEARKIFLLACKAGNFLDESAVAKIASHTGYEEEYVRSTLETIREKCARKREVLRGLRERQNACYIRAQRCLFEMKFLERDSSRHRALEREYEYCVKRLERLRAQSARQVKSPSNRFIASTLGLSRGTVDTTLASALQEGYPDES